MTMRMMAVAFLQLLLLLGIQVVPISAFLSHQPCGTSPLPLPLAPPHKLLLSPSYSPFQGIPAQPQQRQHHQPLYVITDREPDILEMIMGGERYEMVPLPDRMCDTTVFVGNLCEFVRDEDLSQLFQAVSVLQSVPSCVVRKANMQSLRYGFVSFLTVEEKEAAILRFHGSEWRGRRIKVEDIRDDPKCGRVNVPERMVSYVSGSLKKTRNGKVNSMRNARGDAADESSSKKGKKKANKKANKRKAQLLLSKPRQRQRSRATAARSRLSHADREELDRANRKGFLTLDGRNAGHGSLANLCSSEALGGLRLAVAHREWCDEREKPNIILYKASGRTSKEVLDHIVVDLSPLRDQVSEKLKSEIVNAAASAGMDLQSTADTDACSAELASSRGDENKDGVKDAMRLDQVYRDPSGPRRPISRLPFVSLGFFIGERSSAKAMAKELALMWDLPEIEENPEIDTAESATTRHHQKGGRYHNNHGRAGRAAPNAQDQRRAARRKVRRDDWEQSMGKYLLTS